MAEEHRALHNLLQKLRQRPLVERDTQILRTLVVPLTPLIFEALEQTQGNMVFRGNLLRLLEQAPQLELGQVRRLEAINERDAGWLSHYLSIYLKLQSSPFQAELSLLLETLRQTLVQGRNQLLQAQQIASRSVALSPEEVEALGLLYDHPVACDVTEDPGRAAKEALPKICPAPIAQAILKVSRAVELPPPTPLWEVEDIILELFSGQSRWLTCAALYSFSQVCQHPEGAAFKRLEPGGPAAEAVLLCQHRDAWIREAAVSCLTVMYSVERPQPVLKALLQAVKDSSPMVRDSAEAPLTASII